MPHEVAARGANAETLKGFGPSLFWVLAKGAGQVTPWGVLGMALRGPRVQWWELYAMARLDPADAKLPEVLARVREFALRVIAAAASVRQGPDPV